MSDMSQTLLRLNLTDGDVETVIVRQDKGLEISLYPKCVIKHYGFFADRLTPEEQTQRFENELMAYQRFGKLDCPFVPQLLDYSISERWICIERVSGQSLLEITQTSGSNLPMAAVLKQLDAMNAWLRENNFTDTKSNTKDMILTPDGQLYMIDFESYHPQIEPNADADIYNALINCVMERTLVRKGMTAKLTPAFFRLVFGILRKRPGKALRFIVERLRVSWRTWIMNSALYRGLKHFYRRIIPND
jgi:tRNA A-37 threonylcarbamoyl transferase component Bud32